MISLQKNKVEKIFIYKAGREARALGGKLLGAGGGGFMPFVVRPEDRSTVRDMLKDLIHVSFKFEAGGSKIVVFEPKADPSGP